VEVLEERLETDRSIVRTLVLAAQHWEEFRLVLKTQVQRIAFLRDVYGDPRWVEDRINNFETMAIANGYVQRFERIDFRISTELLQETDALIQRVTNLISIDEGYRSRDQNDSIRRLTWITASRSKSALMES
jgi:glutaredoxin 2